MRPRSSEVFSFLRIGLSVAQLRSSITLFFLALVCLVGCANQISAQQTNPVDRKVTNPITDTPNVNPLTQDRTRLYFTADRVERISLDTIIATNAQITACDEEVPKWSFHARRVKIKTGDRVRIASPSFHVKGVPVFYLPYASVSIKRRDR